MAGGFVGIDESAGAMRLLLLDALARERLMHRVKGLGSRVVVQFERKNVTLAASADFKVCAPCIN